MICALDIGNSSLKGGLFDVEGLRETFRISLEEGETTAVRQLADRLKSEGVVRLGISSVVPSVSDAIRAASATIGVSSIFVVSHRSKLPFSLEYETPETLGVDRIAAAAGAWERLGGTRERPIVVVDAGTAVTVDLLIDGAMPGGVIVPGPELQRRAVRSGTAQLPVVDLAWPSRVVSRSTREAVAAGIMFTFVDGIRGLLLRIIDEIGRQPHVIATGGWGRLLTDKIELVEACDPDLVIRGVAALMSLNE